MSESPQSTPDALIAAALHLFGHRGYEGTSTRAIAERAGTNVASIAYHFGGKEGLRQACARSIATRVTGAVDTGATAMPATPAEAEAAIERAVRAIVQLIVVAPEAEDIVAFMVRELTDPGPVADMIFNEFLLPRHRMLCRLWSLATGRDAEVPGVLLAVFGTIGQVFYFRVARPFVEKRMGWDQTGPEEGERIAAMVLANLRAQRRAAT